jgi:PAP2 superfamily
MPNLMLSWQQATVLAACCGAAGILLVRAGRAAGGAGRAARLRRYATHAGPFLREAGVVVALYALWQLAGNLATGGVQQALAHARWIWHVERTLHLPSELDVQRLLLPHPLLSQIANIYYATMHFGVLIAVLIWMFAWHRDRYPALRNAMAASTAICLLISFIPVAPPRMLTQLGFVDLAAKYGQSVYSALGLGADQLSAMPSVHVAWSVLVSWAVITSGVSRWRWLILLHPAVTVFVVVGTGNHFWADGIVAATVVAVVLGVRALLLRRVRDARGWRAGAAAGETGPGSPASRRPYEHDTSGSGPRLHGP